MNYSDRERPGKWAEDGSCRGSRTKWWFPTDVKNPTIEETEARRICAECPVRSECLEFAMKTREKHGIWGGRNYEEREQLRRRRRREAKRQTEVLPWRDDEPLSLEQAACRAAFEDA